MKYRIRKRKEKNTQWSLNPQPLDHEYLDLPLCNNHRRAESKLLKPNVVTTLAVRPKKLS